MEIFRVYKSVDISSLGVFTIVLTADCDNTTKCCYAEYYIFIPNRDPSFFQGEFSFNSSYLPDKIIEINEDFMIEEAFHRAKERLSKYFLELENKYNQAISFQCELIEPGEKEIVGLCLRGMGRYEENIRAMRERTQCESLTKILDQLIYARTSRGFCYNEEK